MTDEALLNAKSSEEDKRQRSKENGKEEQEKRYHKLRIGKETRELEIRIRRRWGRGKMKGHQAEMMMTDM